MNGKICHEKQYPSLSGFANYFAKFCSVFRRQKSYLHSCESSKYFSDLTRQIAPPSKHHYASNPGLEREGVISCRRSILVFFERNINAQDCSHNGLDPDPIAYYYKLEKPILQRDNAKPHTGRH